MTWSWMLAIGVAALTGVARGQEPAANAELPGSTRNARVATVVPSDPAERMKHTLTLLTSGLSEGQIAELGTVAPNVRVINLRGRDAAIEHAAEADAADGRLVTEEFLAGASKLTWVHSPSAGVERLLGVPGLQENPKLVITNARGVHGPAIADHALAMLLSLTRQLPYYRSAQDKAAWSRDDPPQRPVALAGKTMLVVGLGGIGTEVARRGHGFGMRVVATRRSEAAAPEFVEEVGKADDLGKFLPQADVVVICVPLTKETEGLFDETVFAAMKPGAFLINIARGKIVKTDAMIDAIKSGRLAGAGLDVTDPEPLPKDHALWSTPNVLITPHVAAEGELTDQRWWALYKENVRRFGAGQPLLNCVDVKAGY